MSVIPSQPLTSSSEPAPVVSDIPAPQPLPAANPAPINGTASPSVSSRSVGVSPGSAPTNSGPVHSEPTPPSHGPPPAPGPVQPPSHFTPAATPANHNVPHRPVATPQPQPQQQSWGQQGPADMAQQRLVHAAPQHQSWYPPSEQLTPNSFQSKPAQHPQQQQSYQTHPQQQQGYQTQQQQNYQSQSSRPMIIEPPRKRTSMGMAAPMPQTTSVTSGFPSPKQDYPAAFPKFSDDLSRNTLAIKQSVPEAVRQAVRDNWEKCLLGSEFHQAFVLNASMHHSTPSVQNRAVHDFGANLVANCKAELIKHFSNRDIDDVADLILAKASNAFLDKALEMRLATIDAKPLINALARAERLGYDSQDLVEMSQGEHVIPTGLAPPNVPGPVRTNGNRLAHPTEPQCLKCFRTFEKKSYFDYHVSRSVCSKIPPTADGFRHACPKCGQGFTHTGGLSYHTLRNVCEGGANGPSEPQHSDHPATPSSVRSTASPAQPPSTQTQTPSSSQAARTNLSAVMPANRPKDLSVTNPNTHDPYAHLGKAEMDLLNAELLEAEKMYASRFQEAEAMADPEQRRLRLDSLRNSFGTKQSMIRKKYGVRLRERRTRAEILAERDRMGLRGKAQRTGSQSPAPTRQHGQGQAQAQTTPSTSQWTPANRVVSSVDLTGDDPTPTLKRRRVDEGQPYPSQQTGPTTRVSEMAGGLTASSATAATHDPTLPPPSSTPARTYQQAGARVEIHLPSKGASPSKPSSAAASVSGGGVVPNGHASSSSSSRDDSRTPEAMEVDDDPANQLQQENIKADVVQEQEEEESEDENEENENEHDVVDREEEDSSDSDSDDADIPASLPASVRESLTSSQLGPMY